MSESDDSTFLCKQRKPRQLKNKLYFKTVKAATISDVTTGVVPPGSWILEPSLLKGPQSDSVERSRSRASTLISLTCCTFNIRVQISSFSHSRVSETSLSRCRRLSNRSVTIQKTTFLFHLIKSRMFRVLIRLSPELRVFQSVCGYICSFTLTRTVCVTAEVTQDVNAGG